jgi:hypothetical protein
MSLRLDHPAAVPGLVHGPGVVLSQGSHSGPKIARTPALGQGLARDSPGTGGLAPHGLVMLHLDRTLPGTVCGRG